MADTVDMQREAEDELSIKQMVAAAVPGRTYLRKEEGRLLVRCERGKMPARLVDCSWVTWWPQRLVEPVNRFEAPEWEELCARQLRGHVRRYLVEDLVAPTVGWRQHPFRRLRLGRIGRSVLPVLRGGGARKIDAATANRARDSYVKALGKVKDESLPDLEEQAKVGFEHQRERARGAEQRANFFLGAAGLTTTIVLANASLLIGSEKLDSPWRTLAGAALIFASLCALLAGIRALQAAMVTFSRTPPNSVGRLMNRRRNSKLTLQRCYVAALLVSNGRTSVVADWKISRMSSARRWFGGAIAGVVLLTAFVLVDAFFGAS